MGLILKSQKINEIEILVVKGRIIDVDSRRMKTRFEALYKKDDSIMVVNITDAEFIDSHGLGVIVYYHTLMQKSGKKMYLVDLSPTKDSYMKRLLELTQLEKVLNVINSYDVLEVKTEV